MKYYINCYTSGANEITHKYIENNERKIERVRFQPIYGYRVNEQTDWKDIYGNNIKTIKFDSMTDARNWKKDNEMLGIYGDISNSISFITQNYPSEIKPQKSLFNIYNIDIEVYVGKGSGFPKASNPLNYINAVTFQNMVTKIYYVFSLKDYVSKDKNVNYYKCKNEEHLLENILDFCNRQDIDIITGWNINAFDIPYIIDRINLLIGEDAAKRISPDRKIIKDTKLVNKRMVTTYYIQGIILFDYYDLYTKFTFDNKESYTLDYIASYELGKEKLKYKEEYGNLNSLYENNFEMFIDYNIQDVTLVDSLDQKLKFIDIALNYAYMMRCNPDDIFGTVKPWDSLLYFRLFHQNILCSPNRVTEGEEYVGGYVKEPDKGLHDWIVVYDIISSYPNQMISFNLSPETILSENILKNYPELLKIRKDFAGYISSINDEKYLNIDKCIDIDSLEDIKPILQKYNVTFTCNGHFFKTDKQGFIPSIVQEIFNERLGIKEKIKKAKAEKNKEEQEYLESRSQILKIAINSVYGCLGSNYFRYYDPRIASAVTWQGQLCARGVAHYIINKCKDIDWKYSDTDSIMLSLKKALSSRYIHGLPNKETIIKFLLKYQEKIIEPIIEEFFLKLGQNLNTKDMTIKMECECIADLSIFVEKKKYAMHQVWKEGEWFLDKPKLKIKGIEVVRSSTPQIVRDKLKKAIELIFETGDNDILIEFISNTKQEFFTLPFESVSFPRGLNISNYTLESKSVPIQVRAALIYNKALHDHNLSTKYQEIGDGSKIKFCYIKVPNIFKSNVLGILDKVPEEFSKLFKIDYDTQFDKAFCSPLKKIFDSIDWKFEKGNSLEKFF